MSNKIVNISPVPGEELSYDIEILTDEGETLKGRVLAMSKTVVEEAETFDDDQIIDSIKSFLRNGEDTATEGYYCGYGWAARCLRYHLDMLVKKRKTVSD